MKHEQMDASSIASAVTSGEVSAVEVVSASLRRIRSLEPRLNALITVIEEYALERAAHVDGQVSSGCDPGPLAGVPVVVKDNMCTGESGQPAQGILDDWEPPMMPRSQTFEGARAVIVGNRTWTIRHGSSRSTPVSALLEPQGHIQVPGELRRKRRFRGAATCPCWVYTGGSQAAGRLLRSPGLKPTTGW
jgi:aspartyl-tRNA(Asn)/glutamyl-tRNA(Gln) amidotransferase subunit A